MSQEQSKEETTAECIARAVDASREVEKGSLAISRLFRAQSDALAFRLDSVCDLDRSLAAAAEHCQGAAEIFREIAGLVRARRDEIRRDMRERCLKSAEEQPATPAVPVESPERDDALRELFTIAFGYKLYATMRTTDETRLKLEKIVASLKARQQPRRVDGAEVDPRGIFELWAECDRRFARTVDVLRDAIDQHCDVAGLPTA